MFKLRKTRRQSPATRGRRLAFEVLERREVLSGAWHNAWLPADVTGDQQVAPIDALYLINEINARGARQLPTPGLTMQPPPYLDPTDDGKLSADDVLYVINELNHDPPQARSPSRRISTSAPPPRLWPAVSRVNEATQYTDGHRLRLAHRQRAQRGPRHERVADARLQRDLRRDVRRRCTSRNVPRRSDLRRPRHGRARCSDGLLGRRGQGRRLDIRRPGRGAGLSRGRLRRPADAAAAGRAGCGQRSLLDGLARDHRRVSCAPPLPTRGGRCFPRFPARGFHRRPGMATVSLSTA